MKDPKEARDYLDEWLDNFKKASDAVPFVQKARDVFNWQCEAISQQPKGMGKYPLYNPSSGYSMSIGDIPKLLPMVPKIDIKSVTHVNTIATSAASGTYGQIIKMTDETGELSYVYFQSQSTKYQELQRSQNKIEEIRNLIKTQCSDSILDQYNRAETAYLGAKSGVGEESAAALEMRTLIDNIKGELFEKSRHVPKENMTWPGMADRLCPSDKRPTEHSELNNQGDNRVKIIDYLSKILKRREERLHYNINDIWTMVLDHISIVLNILSV